MYSTALTLTQARISRGVTDRRGDVQCSGSQAWAPRSGDLLSKVLKAVHHPPQAKTPAEQLVRRKEESRGKAEENGEERREMEDWRGEEEEMGGQ